MKKLFVQIIEDSTISRIDEIDILIINIYLTYTDIYCKIIKVKSRMWIFLKVFTLILLRYMQILQS